MNSFEKTFEDWLEESLSADISENVRAFSFNLDESAFEDGYKFGIELIGAERFDADDEDWACDEIWEPLRRNISIPLSYSGEHWKECLSVMKKLIVKLLDSNKSFAQKLKSKEAVGIGFVDGNLENIWIDKEKKL